jgi:hypothetical protein
MKWKYQRLPDPEDCDHLATISGQALEMDVSRRHSELGYWAFPNTHSS